MDQDWNPVTIHGSKASPKLGPAKRNDAAVAMAKLADAEGPVHVKVLSPASVRAVQEFRRANTLTQKDLDHRLSFPPNTINGLESRKYAPSTGQLNALNRLLKAGLTLE
jgi:ribosome-binding protein aMBF1 (putative translation factor)